MYSYNKTYNILSDPSNEGFSAPYGDMSNQLVNNGWWLKTPLNDLGYACFHSYFRDEVHSDGGFTTTADFVGVRPTITISNDLIKHVRR